MASAVQTRLIGASLSMAMCGPVAGQGGPPPASLLDDITACSLDGDMVFVVTGRDASARRYKYAWDAAIDALCNAKGFAIGAPVKATAAPATARPAAPAPTPPATATAPAGAPSEFPADARPISADDLARKLSGKVFNVELQNGVRWRLDYKSNGYVFVNVSTGGTASGPWRAEDGRVCTHIRGGSPSCNEVRDQGQRLYLKRDNGEVIALSPQ